MRSIEQYAYSLRVRSVDPAQKVGVAFLVLIMALVLDRPAVGLLAVLCMWGLARYWAGLPGAVFGRLLLAEGFFLLLAVSSVAISVSASAQGSGDWGWRVGPLWLGASSASLDMAGRLAARALGGAAAMNFLALTTPMVDVLDVMRRVRIPGLLVDLMTLIYRYVFALLESLTRMHVAQDSRLGYATFRRGMASAGVLASQLFIDAHQRSLRLQNSLDSRGYGAELRVLPLQYRRDPTLLGLALAIAGSLFLARILI